MILGSATYKILYATTGSTWKESGILSDTRVYQFISLIFGYRESDFKITAVPVDIHLTEFSEPWEIERSEIKSVKYRKKDDYLDMIPAERGRSMMYFGFGDISSNSRSFVDNISQEAERQELIAFIEKYKT